MAFITASQVASYSGLDSSTITTAQIEAAEAVAAGYMGTDTLELTDRTDVIYPRNNRTKLILSYGPVANMDAFTSVTINTSAVALSNLYMAGYWMLSYPTGLFSNGVKHTLVYETGWDSSLSDPLPTNVLKALLIICAGLSKDPTGIFKSEKIGDYSYTKAGEGENMIDNAVPDSAKILLAPFVRPDFLY